MPAIISGIRVVIVLVVTVTTATMVRFPMLDAQGRRLASSLKTLPMLGSQQSLTIKSLFELVISAALFYNVMMDVL